MSFEPEFGTIVVAHCECGRSAVIRAHRYACPCGKTPVGKPYIPADQAEAFVAEKKRNEEWAEAGRSLLVTIAR